MSDGRIVVIGAGLAGLSAAVLSAQSGAAVTLLEAAGQAGGRCRSYFDAALGQVIDNGNHLVLSGNHDTFNYLRSIGAEQALTGPERARFAFADVARGARWTIAPNDGALPWWLLLKHRRVPGTTPKDYLALARLLRARADQRVCDVIRCEGALWDRLMAPFLLAALNTEPRTASAALAGAVIGDSLARGGRHYRPRIATPTLAAAFVAPALALLASSGAEIRFNARVRQCTFARDRVSALAVGEEAVCLGAEDRVVLATPPFVTRELLPGITVPDDFRAIVNAHFKQAPPKGAAAMTGVIGGAAEWVFAFEGRFSVTVSGADRLVDLDRQTLAEMLWRDVAAVHGLPAALPPWQIVKEKRATFAATPEQAAKRPPARTAYANLFLAGDWTDTGLPATIEGAVRSGQRAARLALGRRFV
jgi:squalene-associated FAD-dependent desaturase